jgi:hypothetical protein
MNKILRLSFFILILISLLLIPTVALAQTYLFSMDSQIVNIFVNEDGTTSIDYLFTFTNDRSASPIDFVDVGLPNSSFVDNSISADVDGEPITDISRSGYQGQGGSGVAVGLGSNAIKPGKTGRVHVFIGTQKNVLYTDSQDKNYTSLVFSPTWFGSQYVKGTTKIQVYFHLPLGVKPEEPKWHEAPSGFPSQPATGLDDQGRVTYLWENDSASGSTQYTFGASFPKQYVAASAIVKPSIWETLGINPSDLMGFTMCCGFIAFIVLIVGASFRSTQARKLQYLPPRIAIEGHGIKRGLTAIEAAILLEQPLDKIMTMILFSVIKKNAAAVVTPDPLKLNVTSPLPEGLQDYEKQFLDAFQQAKLGDQRLALQNMMIELVKSLSNKMKGFSRRETVVYYRDIVQRAWTQVEAADTPEVKSQKYDEVMEWTMLDKDYGDRTRDVFHGGPVFIPMWWPRYDPTYSRPSAAGTLTPTTSSIPSAGGRGSVSLPTLPGGTFAASIVTGVQNFSSNVIGNVTDFTSGVTNKTNPVPIVTSTSSHGGGGGFHSGGCACACACAGCACACAGGGR